MIFKKSKKQIHSKHGSEATETHVVSELERNRNIMKEQEQCAIMKTVESD